MSKSAVVFEALRSVDLGPSHSFENLSILPLLGSEERPPDYVTLDEALAGGSVLSPNSARAAASLNCR